MLIAVSGNFGFLAPVLAAQSPATIDAINRYPPEAALNVAAFGGFALAQLVAPGLWAIAILRSPASVRGQGMRSSALTGNATKWRLR